MFDDAEFREFATRYTAAWCSQEADSVASFFEPQGSLKINSGEASVGRVAITEAALGFMTAFPDLRVVMDELAIKYGNRATYHWTLTGTNTGPGGSGRGVKISGYEDWQIGVDGLIAVSLGHFDEGKYQRQLLGGLDG